MLIQERHVTEKLLRDFVIDKQKFITIKATENVEPEGFEAKQFALDMRFPTKSWEDAVNFYGRS
jgi:hypothetical protein